MKNNKDTIIHKYFIDKLKPVDIAKELNIKIRDTRKKKSKE